MKVPILSTEEGPLNAEGLFGFRDKGFTRVSV